MATANAWSPTRCVTATSPSRVQSLVDEPAPRVRFRQLGASSLDFQLLVWVPEPRLRGRVIDTLLTQVYKTFNARGIEIPYAKYDVYIHPVPDPEDEVKTP